MNFLKFDLDLDPMTLIFELDLGMVNMYLCARIKFSSSSDSKAQLGQKRYTDTGTQGPD